MDPRLTTRLANLWRGSCCHSCAAELLLLWLLYHTAGRSLCGGSTRQHRPHKIELPRWRHCGIDDEALARLQGSVRGARGLGVLVNKAENRIHHTIFCLLHGYAAANRLPRVLDVSVQLVAGGDPLFELAPPLVGVHPKFTGALGDPHAQMPGGDRHQHLNE